LGGDNREGREKHEGREKKTKHSRIFKKSSDKEREKKPFPRTKDILPEEPEKFKKVIERRTYPSKPNIIFSRSHFQAQYIEKVS